jgi:hypothetical protein
MQVGEKITKNYFESIGGLNNADSPFTVKDSQSTGGYNYDYVRTGGFKKSNAPFRVNSSPDSQLRTLGIGLYNTKTSTKTIVRSAGTKIQSVSTDGSFTNLTEDTAAASSDFLTSGSTQPVVSSMFVSPSFDVLWLAGGGMSVPRGVYSSSKVTKNGSATPTGAITVTESGGGGSFSTTGTYFYAVAYRKAGTLALSNADLDQSVTLSSTTNSVVINLSGLTNLDSTKYDKVYIYRSAVGGVTDFTTGDLVAQLDSTSTSYTDTGSYVSTAENIPRPGNTTLDNSELDSTKTYNAMTVFKRRLVVASDSTIYISDLNKPESWPAGNVITVPSGGKITGVAVIGFNTPGSASSNDEFLAIFKENELWVVTGSSLEDWELKFVDYTGCVGQPLIVSANGYMYFIDNRGVYLWDGAGKPLYISRPIEGYFTENGDLDKANLPYGVAAFFKKQNQVCWFLPSTSLGQNKLMLKLDLRLTLPQVSNTLGERVLDGVFTPGKVSAGVFGGSTFYYPTSSSQEELFITGDDAGYIYRQFYSVNGSGANDYDFTYDTRWLDMDAPGIHKQLEKVIVWVDNVGNWDLVLDYWSDWKTGSDDKSSVSQTINANTSGTLALWDIAQWDVAEWDDFTVSPKKLVFNIGSQNRNNGQGEVFKFRFRNQNNNQPVVVNGFQVVYTNLGMRV